MDPGNKDMMSAGKGPKKRKHVSRRRCHMATKTNVEQSLLKTLETAIDREIRAQDNYSELAGLVKEKTLKNKLKFLAHEESFHRKKLDAWYKEYSGGRKYKTSVEKHHRQEKYAERMSLRDILGKALKKEEEAYDFYQKASQDTMNLDLKNLLAHLSKEEQIHQHVLLLELSLIDGQEYGVALEMVPWHIKDAW
jgi:rubrerythrin